MATPKHLRPVPGNVEIPELPEAMEVWFDLVRRAEGREAFWRRREIVLPVVIDGHSAARALATFRYARTGQDWIDEAGTGKGQWRREWIVIAEHEGDPFIADISKPGVPVLLAEHGLGHWKPRRVHRRIAAFAKSIKITGT